jgi:hypothetical protein
MPLSETQKGWVVICLNHPNGTGPYIIPSTFRYTRKEAIAAFAKDSGKPWEYWRRKYKFQVVKAKQSFTTAI